jgi:hypothetical protein
LGEIEEGEIAVRGAAVVGETWGSVSGLGPAQMQAPVSQEHVHSFHLSSMADLIILIQDTDLGRDSSLVSAIRLDAHRGAASRWAAKERAWSFDGIGRLPAVRARARRRAVADSSILSGHH